MGIYDNDGKIKLTPAPGSGFCGIYAPDGSWYFTLEPGSGFCGSLAPNGSYYVHNATGEGFGGRYAANGALRVTSANEYNGAIRVSGLSSLAVSKDFLSTTAIPSWMTFTATGLATQFDSTGKLTYRPNNLLTQSNTFSNAAWTDDGGISVTSGVSDPDGGTAAWTLTGVSGTNQADKFQTYFNNIQKTFTWTIRVKAGTATWASIGTYDGATDVKQYFNLSNGTLGSSQNGTPLGATITPLTGGWYQLSMTRAIAGAASSMRFQITQATADLTPALGNQGLTLYIYKAVLSAVTYETTPRSADQVITTSAAYYGPRFDYTYNGSSWVAAGLLIEGAATNLFLNSGNLSAASWSAVGTRSTDGTLASDGVTLATKLTAGAGTTAPLIYNPTGLSPASGANISLSWEVQNTGTSKFPVLCIQQSANNYVTAIFDLTTTADGTASQTAVGSTSGTVVSTAKKYLGAGRFRLTLVGSTAGVAPVGFISNALAASGNSINPGGGWTTGTWAGTESIYSNFPQFEVASASSSYIPTAAAAVTRAAETVQLTGAALAALQGASGTAVLETSDIVTTTGAILLMATSNQLLYYNDGPLQTYNGTTLLTTATNPTSRATYRHGIAWSASGRSLAYTGSAVASDANTLSAVTTAYLGSNAGTLPASGHYRSLGLWNSRLPDATLQSQSVVGATYV